MTIQSNPSLSDPVKYKQDCKQLNQDFQKISIDSQIADEQSIITELTITPSIASDDAVENCDAIIETNEEECSNSSMDDQTFDMNLIASDDANAEKNEESSLNNLDTENKGATESWLHQIVFFSKDHNPKTCAFLTNYSNTEDGHLNLEAWLPPTGDSILSEGYFDFTHNHYVIQGEDIKFPTSLDESTKFDLYVTKMDLLPQSTPNLTQKYSVEYNIPYSEVSDILKDDSVNDYSTMAKFEPFIKLINSENGQQSIGAITTSIHINSETTDLFM